MWILLIVVCAFVWGAFAAPPALADQYYDRGLQLFQAEKYPEAQLMFEYRLRVAPKDTNAQFCRAVCLDKQARVGEACEILRSLRKEYPGTDIAKRSADKLVSILGDTFKEELRREQADKSESQHAASQSSHSEHAAESSTKSDATTSSASSIPQNARAYYTGSDEDDDQIIVDVALNGRRLKMQFDTGAHNVLLYRHHVEALGIKIPEKAAATSVHGISGSLPAIIMPMTVELAGIKRTVDVKVADGDGTPLLGQAFLGDLEYELDHKGHFILFRKARAYDPSAKNDMYCVPFRLNGRHLIVDVECLGGKKSPMIVDTGASSILLSGKNFYDFGLATIPAEAMPVAHSGVGGDAPRLGYSFHIEQLKLGPIIARLPKVNVLWSAENQRAINALGPEGLLGQPFFGNWEYTVDMKNKVLRFFH